MAEELTLLLDGKRFRFWETVSINLALDSIDTFSFSTPFNADNAAFRENFQPFTYKTVEIRINNDPIVKGVLISRDVTLTGKTLSLGGYSLPGILNDLPVPPDKYPIEFKDQDLRQIATQLASYYDVEVEFEGSPGLIFSPAVSPEPGEKILAFLIKLAKKRNFLVSNTVSGKLKFFVPLKSQVVTPLAQGAIPLLDVSITYKEQEMFSSVTGLGASQVGRDPEAFTIPISAIKNVNRPFVYTVSEAEGAELQSAVKFKAGRLFANAIGISTAVSTWRGKNAKIWAPGDFIKLRSPNNFFYNETNLLIRNISLQRTQSEESAALTPVFPGVFSGELPSKMPWE